MTEQPGTDVAPRTPQQELMSRVRGDDFKQQVALALPEGVTPDRFARAAATAVLTNPDLATADRDSVFGALLKAAQDGLLPDGREAALVIYKGKAQYLPMIGGFRKIAGEHGWEIQTRVVFSNDEFAHELGVDESIRHVPVKPGAERGERIAAYAIARHRDGRRMLEVMYAEDVERARKKAQTQAVWNEWPDRMWEKTVGKRLFAKLPLGEKDSERIRRLLKIDDLEPGDAARQLYGDPRPTTRELPTGEVVDTTTGEVTPGDTQADVTEGRAAGGDDEQVGGGTAHSPETPAADSSPDTIDGEATELADEPEPQPVASEAESSTFAPPAAVVENAGETPVPKGTQAGQTLAEIAANEIGADWYAWALRRPASVWPKAFRDQLELYARARLPEVWAAYERQPAEAA